ncbi:MAG: carboxypeptidase regulatory-like domain-containing protein [bacterium]
MKSLRTLLFLVLASSSPLALAGDADWFVVSGDDGTPIAGASVTLRPETAAKPVTTSTDASGRIQVPSDLEGSFTIEVRAKGFGRTASGPHPFSHQIQGLKGATLQLFREARITGVVVCDGAPVAKRRVTAHGPISAEATTASDGTFEIAGLPPGAYSVYVDWKGFVAPMGQQAVIQSGGTASQRFELTRGQEIRGIVTLPDGRPVSRVSIATTQGPGYGYTVSGADGSFRISNLVPGRYSVNFWAEGLDNASIRDIDTGRGEALKVVMEPLPPQMEVFSNRRVFAHKEKVTVSLRSLRIDKVRVEAYAVPMDSLVDASAHFSIPSQPPEGAKPVFAIDHAIAYKRPMSWKYEELPIPLKAPGAYLVVVTGPAGPRTLPILISDLGLIVKRAPGEVLAWAVHLGTGAPYPGVRVRVGSADGAGSSGTSDASGLFRATTTEAENVEVTADDGAEIAHVAAPLAPGATGTLKAYVYTDRPVYRPGQHVYWKAIVRRETEEGHAVPGGEPVTVRVRDSQGQLLSESAETLTAMGSITGNLELGSEPPLGLYEIEVDHRGETATGNFKVFEYRKPEFKVEVATDRDRYSPGDSVNLTIRGQYHFGAPLSGTSASWVVYATPFDVDADYYEWGGEDYDAGYGQLVASNVATLGPDGTALASFVVPPLSGDMHLQIEAVVTDASNRSVTGRASTIASRGEFTLAVRANSWVLMPDNAATLVAKASSFSGAPVATSVEMEVHRRAWDSTGRRWTDGVAFRDGAHTSGDGVATIATPPLSQGYYSVVATAHDAGGRAIQARSWFWVADRDWGGVAEEVGALEIVPDKASYKPGEMARVLIHGVPPNGTVLVTEERDRVASAQVLSAHGSMLLVEVPITEADAPNIYLAASTVFQGTHKVRAVPIHVTSSARSLSIAVTPDRPTYRPGDRATVDVAVTDGYGRPVAAEVSLGVVDEAIYQISEELAPDIFKFFHGQRPNRVSTVYSFEQSLQGGADKDSKERSRRNFKDTAFWAPSLATDATGHARVTFDWPDNLTTWRFTARAVTRDTAVGWVKTTALVTKELVSRIHAPRFFTSGDRVEVTVVCNDRSAKPRQLAVSLKAEGAGVLDGSSTQDRAAGPSAEERFSWTLRVNGPGAVRLSARVRDAASASERPEDNEDAMEITLPVVPFGKPFTVVANGTLDDGRPEDEVSLLVPAGAIPQSVKTGVTLNPGVASVAFSSLDDLIGYPYGCAEQTMSRFLPTVIATQVASSMGASLGPKAGEVPRMVAQGTQKLYGYQHQDGGWGWWTDDATHPYMTAYVTWGLWNAKKAGYPIDADRLERGLVSTEAQLSAETDPNTRAFMLHTLAVAGRADRDAAIALFAERAKLSDYGRGLLITVLSSAGERERAATLRSELEARANLGGATEKPGSAELAHWEAETFEHGWMKNSVEATAYAMRGILASDPGSAAADRAARWLVLNRKGTSWHTTKDSAAAVFALMDFTQKREPEPNARLALRVDGKKAQQVTFKGWSTAGTQAPIALPALASGSHKLTIERDGKGRVFYAARVTGVTEAASIAPEGSALRVTRAYRIAERVPEGPGRFRIDTRPVNGPIVAGTLIQVELTIAAGEDTEYVMVEDPLPAGFEVESEEKPPAPECEECEDWGEELPYSHREDRDEKVAFFETSLAKGSLTLTYLMKAETAGSFRVLPTRVEAMYTPGVEGHGASDAFEVLAR